MQVFSKRTSSCPKTRNTLLKMNLDWVETTTFLSPLSWIRAVHHTDRGAFRPWQAPAHAAHCVRHAGSCKRLSHHASPRTHSPMVPHHPAAQVQGTWLIITTYLANILFGYEMQRPVGHAGKAAAKLSGPGMFEYGR